MNNQYHHHYQMLVSLVSSSSIVVNHTELRYHYDIRCLHIGERTSTGVTSPPSILILGGSNVQISPEAVSADSGSSNDDSSSDSNDYVDIHVIQYSPSISLLTCYGNNTISNITINNNNNTLPVDIPLGPITSIDLYNSNGTNIIVSNLSQPGMCSIHALTKYALTKYEVSHMIWQ